MSLKLKRTEDPEDLGDSIAALETEYGSPIDKKQKIAAIVKTAGQYYSDVIQNETVHITGTGGTVTAEDLIEAMGTNWRIGGRITGTAKEFDDSEPNDVSLSNMPERSRTKNVSSVVRKDTWLEIFQSKDQTRMVDLSVAFSMYVASVDTRRTGVGNLRKIRIRSLMAENLLRGKK